ncbi:MAG TPA: response regulator transcription factor [Burkholderiales bacterium]|nr:response regulator transcription factor [Burkholderiales bacterium]
MIRILIADDHAVVRQGVKQFLADTPDITVAGEAATGREVLARLQEQDWDLVLLDLNLPDLSGLEVLKRIKQEKPALPVLIFSMFSEDEYAITALNAGASGYVAKESPPEQILTAIRRATGGGRYVSPALAEKLLTGKLPAREAQPHDKLSRREHEILLLLSRGVPLTRIGEQLHLSVKTVSTYRSRVLEKLGLESNAELARYVLKHKLDH